MNERERLIELMQEANAETAARIERGELTDSKIGWEFLADYLLAHGVTVDKDTNVPTKWTPASDPPKNEGEHLLVCYSDGWICDQYTPFDDGVTHWMPLPEPPKEEE